MSAMHLSLEKIILHATRNIIAYSHLKVTLERNQISDGESTPASSDDEILTFDGAEHCGDKPLRRETLYKMIKILKIPEHC